MRTFSKAYDFLLNPEISGTHPVSETFFPRDLGAHGEVGLRVEFIPRVGKPWVGIFKQGYKSGKVVTGIFPTPHENLAFVVAQGDGYLIDARSPNHWTRIKVFPITSIAESLSERCLVFTDDTRLGGISEDGLEWVSDRIASDELRIVSVHGHLVNLEGWKAEENVKRGFDFDLRSRRQI
jgi:hypothetical protein